MIDQRKVFLIVLILLGVGLLFSSGCTGGGVVTPVGISQPDPASVPEAQTAVPALVGTLTVQEVETPIAQRVPTPSFAPTQTPVQTGTPRP